jgi:hypothetical protein
MMDEPDLFAAAAARDKSLAQVMGHNEKWTARALNYIRLIGAGTILTGETIRERLVIAGIEPGHPNAWGSLIRLASRHRLIEPTGNYVPMRQKKSHARMTPEYRRCK